MMMIKGTGIFILRHKDGKVECIKKHNLIVQKGFDLICNLLGTGGGENGFLDKIKVGSGTTDTNVDMEELEEELAVADVTFAHTEGSKLFTLTADFPEGIATGAITEAAVFNSTSGTIFDRVTFDVINKGADDKFTAVFQFTFS